MHSSPTNVPPKEIIATSHGQDQYMSSVQRTGDSKGILCYNHKRYVSVKGPGTFFSTQNLVVLSRSF